MAVIQMGKVGRGRTKCNSCLFGSRNQATVLWQTSLSTLMVQYSLRHPQLWVAVSCILSMLLWGNRTSFQPSCSCVPLDQMLCRSRGECLPWASIRFQFLLWRAAILQFYDAQCVLCAACNPSWTSLGLIIWPPNATIQERTGAPDKFYLLWIYRLHWRTMFAECKMVDFRRTSSMGSYLTLCFSTCRSSQTPLQVSTKKGFEGTYTKNWEQLALERASWRSFLQDRRKNSNVYRSLQSLPNWSLTRR